MRVMLHRICELVSLCEYNGSILFTSDQWSNTTNIKDYLALAAELLVAAEREHKLGRWNTNDDPKVAAPAPKATAEAPPPSKPTVHHIADVAL